MIVERLLSLRTGARGLANTPSTFPRTAENDEEDAKDKGLDVDEDRGRIVPSKLFLTGALQWSVLAFKAQKSELGTYSSVAGEGGVGKDFAGGTRRGEGWTAAVSAMGGLVKPADASEARTDDSALRIRAGSLILGATAGGSDADRCGFCMNY